MLRCVWKWHFEDEASYHTLNLPSDDEPVSIACGKDFCSAEDSYCKILYTGKAQSMGIKQKEAQLWGSGLNCL
ncbi:hypothetical protein CEXT_121801 [Caerostris extrusa]|uniref:Uncharacterized protein n=1 Tax=Caerostris extrusa TaxID=172846 RepID=A0AAV4VGI0_CAEEX|nr:hypothetical protein CEXT_121801 [Caerostris extrusa]